MHATLARYILSLCAYGVLIFVMSLSRLHASIWSVTQVASGSQSNPGIAITADPSSGNLYTLQQDDSINKISTRLQSSLFKVAPNPPTIYGYAARITYNSNDTCLYSCNSGKIERIPTEVSGPYTYVSNILSGGGTLPGSYGNGIAYNSDDTNLYVLPGDGSLQKIIPSTGVMTQILATGVIPTAPTHGGTAITYNTSDKCLYILPGGFSGVIKVDPNSPILQYPVPLVFGGNSVALTSDKANNLYILPGDTTVQMLALPPKGPPPTVIPGITLPANGTGIVWNPIDENLYVTCSDGSIQQLTQAIPVTLQPQAIGVTPKVVGGAINTATHSTISNVTESADQPGADSVEEDFRFSLSPQRIKLGMGAMTGAFTGENGSSNNSRTIAALEKALGAAKAIKKVTSDVTVWASGVYTQGQQKPMYGNSAAREKHYGVMAGTHYYHKPSKQLLGIAFDIGLGNSVVNTNHNMSSTHNSKQATLYYGKGFADNWSISVHGAFMRIDASHHRPYTPTGSSGPETIATSRGKSHVTTGMVEVSHKYKANDNVHVKSSFGGIYGRTKQFAYKEKDAGANNQAFAASTMNEVSVNVGLKVSLFKKSGEHKTYGLYPHVSYTRYVKMGTMKQRITTINTGEGQVVKSGTAGKNLLSIGMGAGVTDSDANTKVQVGYTASFQKYKKSHEVMLKASMEI